MWRRPAAGCGCWPLAVEVRPPGHTLGLLTDPVALGARLGLADHEAADAVALGRALADHANAVVGLLAALPAAAEPAPDEPWVRTADGGRLPLRTACPQLAGWLVGTVRVFGEAEVDDLFAVDLAAAAQAATARQGSTGRALLVASLSSASGPEGTSPAGLLGGLLAVPVRSPVPEPTAVRLGALTTPEARLDALVVDLGAGTIDVIGPASDVVAAGAGELLTAAVAETPGIPWAAADWVKRGPCLRVDGGQRFEAEDGSRGFLATSAPASAAGMLVVAGGSGPTLAAPDIRPKFPQDYGDPWTRKPAGSCGQSTCCPMNSAPASASSWTPGSRRSPSPWEADVCLPASGRSGDIAAVMASREPEPEPGPGGRPGRGRRRCQRPVLPSAAGSTGPAGTEAAAGRPE